MIKKIKIIMSFGLVLSILLSNLTVVNALDEEITSVLDGTFNQNDFVTNLISPTGDSSWIMNQSGATCDSQGDSFLVSESTGDNFVYEADIKFNERKGAASLIFRIDGGLDNKNMYVANLNGETGAARLFKFENNQAIDLARGENVSLNDANEYHLKITAIDKHMVYYINGELIINTADYTMNESAADSHFGQNDVIDNGKFGLLTWNGNVSYQNVNYTPIDSNNSPELTNLSVSSVDGKVDKQIQFAPGQYVYIAYVDNATTTVKLAYDIQNDSEIVASNEQGEIVDLNNLAIDGDLTTYTLTVGNGNAKVVYRVRVHRMQPDESYYNEDYRGQYHYSVKDGWANDPNGMVYYKGVYHLFYQYYDGPQWGPMHWAHATSTDMINWQEEPIEFYPDEYGTMFSGCAVIADHETAPDIFLEGEEGIVFLITANGTSGGDGQRIIGAYSKDGETFHKYEEGKVLLDWKDDVLNSPAFRDPKVFRYENKWFMVLAGGPLRIYSSDNLVDWEVESAYGDLHTECPDLYPIAVENADGTKTGEVKWVLNRGGRKYKIGDFKEVNGKWEFVPDAQYASPNANGMGNEENDGIMNFGMDSYAAMTYYFGDFGTKSDFNEQEIIAINWMNTWDSGFCNAIPQANGNTVFNGTFNLQCELGIVKDTNNQYFLTQNPIEEYATLRKDEGSIEFDNVKITSKNNVLSDFSGDSYEIIANITPAPAASEVGFKVRTGGDEETVIKYTLNDHRLTIDRSQSGVLVVNDNRINVNSQEVTLNDDGSIDFHIFVDRSSVEVFSKGNTVAGAMQIFANPLSQGVEVYSEGGRSYGDIAVYELNTIWEDKLQPTAPLAIGLNHSELTGYVKDIFTLTSWVSPSEISQDVVFSTDNPDVMKLNVKDNTAKIKAKKAGNATITVASKLDPTIKKECVVKIYENNFATNLEDFQIMSGSWVFDDTVLAGSHNDNGFIYANKMDTDEYVYEIDAKYETGILNFIVQAQSTNAWDGCYSVQLNGNTVRLFDFKNDYTFASVDTLVRPEDNQYHLKITVSGNSIIIAVNGKEYINRTIVETDRQYTSGYVGLGLYNATAQYQNFYVTTPTGN